MSVPRLIPLTGPERTKHQATHVVIVTAAMAAAIAGASTANTAVAVPLFTAFAGTLVQYLGHHLPTPFKNSADAAFNTNTSIVGDAGSTNRLATSQELNANGTYKTYGPVAAPATTQPYLYDADTVINATIGSMSAKKISDLTDGEVRYFFRLTGIGAISKNIPTA